MNIFQSVFQKVHKNYPSIGWSRLFSEVGNCYFENSVATAIAICWKK